MPPSRNALFWSLQAVGWIAFGLAMTAWGLEQWDLGRALAYKAVLVAIGLALSLALRTVYHVPALRRLPPPVFGLTVVAGSFATGAVWAELYFAVLLRRPPLFPLDIGTVMFYGFVMLAWSLLYLGIGAWIALTAERVRAERAERSAQAARLAALRAQLSPHFLFNTLNAISTLVHDGQGPEAVRLIGRLGDCLRMTLDTLDRPEITLAEELDFLRRYLEIEQARFGDRLRVTFDVAEDASPALVPTLLLQPLVENALKHGVLPREEGGAVSIRAARRDGRLVMSVRDDGPGVPRETNGAHGVGLANTTARLLELYGTDACLTVGAAAGGGADATVELPYRTAAKA